ncbi:MAG: hypothetical protein NVS2B14_01570 [Chamaesiphon sp.]
MFNATEVLIDAFVEKLREGYHRTYGGYKPDYADIIRMGREYSDGKYRQQ